MTGVILRGLVSIGVMFAVPQAAALVANRLVGVPQWLLYAPVACWAAFTALYLAVAVYGLHLLTDDASSQTPEPRP